mgnify:CR=1 FL=1
MQRRELLVLALTGTLVGSTGCVSIGRQSSPDDSPDCSRPTLSRVTVRRQVECADRDRTEESVWADVNAGDCHRSVEVVAKAGSFVARSEGRVSVTPGSRGLVRLNHSGWPDRGETVSFSLLDESGRTLDEMTTELSDYRYRPMYLEVQTHRYESGAVGVGEELVVRLDVENDGGEGHFRATLGVDGETRDTVRDSMSADHCGRESPMTNVELETTLDSPGEYTVYVDVEPIGVSGPTARGYVGVVRVEESDDT